MKPLLHYMRRYWHLYLLGFAGMAVSVGLDMMAPQITRKIIDHVIGDGQTQLLFSLVLGLLGIGIGRAVFQYIKEFTYDYIGVTVGRDMRGDLFEKLQGMSVDFFDRHNTGEVMTRVKDDIDKGMVCSRVSGDPGGGSCCGDDYGAVFYDSVKSAADIGAPDFSSNDRYMRCAYGARTGKGL